MASGLKYLEATASAHKCASFPDQCGLLEERYFVDNCQAGNLGHTRKPAHHRERLIISPDLAARRQSRPCDRALFAACFTSLAIP